MTVKKPLEINKEVQVTQKAGTYVVFSQLRCKT